MLPKVRKLAKELEAETVEVLTSARSVDKSLKFKVVRRNWERTIKVTAASLWRLSLLL